MLFGLCYSGLLISDSSDSCAKPYSSLSHLCVSIILQRFEQNGIDTSGESSQKTRSQIGHLNCPDNLVSIFIRPIYILFTLED
jgi:hypothetical protein